jgi:hypothetical protein
MEASVMDDAGETMHARTGGFIDAYLTDTAPEDARGGLVFGVGLLIGGGWPQAAADVARASEAAFPLAVWPWTNAKPKPRPS